MSSVILAKAGEQQQAVFQCTWHTRGAIVTDSTGSTSWQSVDVTFKELSSSPGFSWPENVDPASGVQLSVELSADNHAQLDPQDFGSASAFSFVLDGLAAAHREKQHGSIASLVVPRSRGYIVRSDLISQRLLGCPVVTAVASFAKPHQLFDPGNADFAAETLGQLPRVFAASAGAMLLKVAGVDSIDALLAGLDLELRNRLSFPWLSTREPRRQTLAIVDGGISGPDNGGTGGSIYLAAQALGIDMVVFDTPNHWVNGPKYSHWRKATVPLATKLEPDADFAQQIADAVRSYDGPIDGILTFRDHYKSFVAEAALLLSLPTYPPSAYEISTDKFKTSVSEGHHAFRASDADEAARIVREHKLEFPLIIKPTNGFLSEGVFRVEDLAQLEAGVRGINTERHGSEFVIEKYCEGPEVDANFVLCDGKLLFFEVSDDFPKTGDVNGQGSVKSFIELANVLPSKLPENELAVLRDSLHQSLLRMGFRDGFYHLEARVENSRMEYATRDGVLDLYERSASPQKKEKNPCAWLIEVNPRPPGIQASEAARYTYGLDYFALGLLFALDDKERATQLSHPFAQGPQYWCEMLFIPVEQGGVYQSGDVCADLFARRPDLAAAVSSSFCFLRKGDAVNDPSTGVNSWVAYFDVFSRVGRKHLLELAEEVRREVKFSIV
ncbi:ATP-grasp domain-containing protein [Chaetomidium leptoderma]|uniref:ATP-grasp domain-containing protein n=1 Tax=Chaetomidium leptoderma TaxID=669021 RepID=A0AAN6VRD8_9PEZI|nr:ATP-grasp domain-containing protein [Chaetomidium leptoderma]